jgi:hypothetical protein
MLYFLLKLWFKTVFVFSVTPCVEIGIVGLHWEDLLMENDLQVDIVKMLNFTGAEKSDV